MSSDYLTTLLLDTFILEILLIFIPLEEISWATYFYNYIWRFLPPALLNQHGYFRHGWLSLQQLGSLPTPPPLLPILGLELHDPVFG